MSIRNRQIGWSQESNLWWEVLRQVNKLSQQLYSKCPNPPTNAKLGPIPPRQIGWSNEAELIWEISKELNKTISIAQDCYTTTTTSTTIDPNNLTLKIGNSENFNIVEKGDFTIEWWAKMSSDSNHPRPWSVGSWPSAAHAVSIESGFFYYWINGSIVINIDLSMFTYLNTWTHFCVMRTTDTIFVYINGVFLYGMIDPEAISTSGYPLYLGSEGNDSIQNGLMSNFRWNNTAVYPIFGFTPPTAPLTNILGTQLLIFQGTTLGQELTDNSGHGYTITNGSGIYNSDNPFGGYQGSVQFGTV